MTHLRIAVVSTAIVAAFAAGSLLGTQAPVKTEEPPYRGLDANLYMQSAAEYRACCLQAYNLATLRLKAVAAEAKPGEKLAVILDLDETVFDNAAFQAEQIRGNFAYDQQRWEHFEMTGGDRVGLIPGAKDFLLAAEKLGVTPVYISNRNAKSFAECKRTILRLQLPFKDDACLKLADETTRSNKDSRRADAEMDYKVVLLIGDNLRDYDEKFHFDSDLVKAGKHAEAVAARFQYVVSRQAELGTRFIILPNPAYGEWNKVLGRGLADLERLVPAKP